MISGRKATIDWLHGSAPASARAVPPLVSYPPKVTTLVWPPSHLGFGGATKCGTCLAVAGGSTAAGVRGIGDHMYCMYVQYGVRSAVLFLSFCWDSAFSSFHHPNVVAASYSKYTHQLTSIQLVVHFAAI